MLTTINGIVVEGVDLSEEQVKTARERYGLANVYEGDANQFLEGRREAYDVIVCRDLLEHLPLDELIRLGKNIRAALSQDGLLMLQVPNGHSPMTPYLWADLTHCRAFTVNSIKQFCSLVELSPVGFYEACTHIRNIPSLAKALLWKVLIRPLTAAVFRIAHGGERELVLTGNIIAVAIKGRDKSEKI